MNRLLQTISLWLIAWSVVAQSPDSQGNTNQPRGGRWSSRPGITQLSSVGQPAAATSLQSADQVWSGSVGFLTPFAELGNNLSPIAIVPGSIITLENDLNITLSGFDPEGDEIIAEIITQPMTGNLTAVLGTDFDFTFHPNASVIPDRMYQDNVVFRIKEKESSRASATAVLEFRYQLSDEAHIITSAVVTTLESGANLKVSWKDPRFNDSYKVIWSFHDLENPNAPVVREISNVTYDKDQLTASQDTLESENDVSISNPHFFNAARVLISVKVVSDNGQSDVFTSVIENNSSGRTETSEDGQFFALGSELDVIENRSTTLQFYSIDLGDFDVSTSEAQVIQQPHSGAISSLAIKNASTHIKSWQAVYQGFAEVGGKDSIQFRIYHIQRQIYDTAWAYVNVIDVNDVPRLQGISDQVTDEEVSLTVPILASDPDNYLEYIVTSSEASGVAVGIDGASLLINPGVDFSGRASITLIAKEAGGGDGLVAFQQFDIQVNDVNDAPVVTPITNKTIAEDTQLFLAVSATDVDASVPLFTYSASISDPTKFTISVDESNIQILPKANVFGDFEVSVFADDQLGTVTSRSVAETFTLSITPVNDAPVVLSTIKSQTLFEGMPSYNINLGTYFTDVENGANLTYALSGNSLTDLSVTGSTLTVNGAGTLVDFEDVTIIASDGEFEVSQTVTFLKSQTNSDIVLNQNIATVELNEDFGSYELDLAGVFSDAANATALFSYEVLGNNYLTVSVSEAGNSLIISSASDFNGQDDVFLIASTGDKSAYTSFDITVAAVNDAPVIGDVADFEVLEDLISTPQFVAISDVDNAITELTITPFSRNTQLIPASNVATTRINSGFNVTVQPSANLSGTAIVGLILSDGALVDSVEFEVTVSPVNDAPTVASTVIIQAIEDVALVKGLSSYFSDIENDPLTLTVVSKPGWLSLSGKNLIGTPTNDHVGTNEIAIRASDGNGGQVTTKLTVQVANTNDAPELVRTAGSMTAFQESEFVYDFPITHFDDIDVGDKLNFTFESYPDWMILTNQTLSGTPQYDDLGDYKVVMKATDNAGALVTDTLFLAVEFTVYDVAVTVDVMGDCDETTKTVSATGAFDYNWYDASGQLIQEGGSTITLSGHPPTGYFVEGVNEAGYKTPERIPFSIDCPLGVESPVQIEVYPNPAQDRITIRGAKNDAELMLIDALGRSYQPKEIQQSGNTRELDLSELNAGMYFIRIVQGSNQQVIKLVKTN